MLQGLLLLLQHLQHITGNVDGLRGFHIVMDDETVKNLRELAGDNISLRIEFFFYDNSGRSFKKESNSPYLYVSEDLLSSSPDNDYVNCYNFSGLYGDLNVQITFRDTDFAYRFIVNDLDFNSHSAYDINLKVTKNK